MKKFKSMGLSICALFLATAIFFGGMSTLAFARADGGTTPPAPEVLNAEFFAAQIVDNVQLNDKIYVPVATNDYEVSIKAPNGKTLTPVEEGVAPDIRNYVVAGYLGNYTIEIKVNKGWTRDVTTYTYNVLCSMDEEYSIFVDYNGAQIPTYMATGDSFEVPNAVLAYEDEDGELVPHANTFTISVSSNGTYNSTDNKVTANSHGTMVLRYSVNIEGGKYYSKEFKIFVQNDFVDESNPKLNVANVPTTANVNTKVSLPIATATDNFDERVFVEVKVWHETIGEVKKIVTIDEDTGYALPDENLDVDPVVFDNVRTMSFYPTATGTYRVSYKAIDTSGNESTEHVYSIECTDGLAPVFVDFDTSDIPTKWGLEVINDNGNRADTSITLPIPTVRDNFVDEGNLTVSARIIDADNRTVLRFTNILDAKSTSEGKTGHIASNPLYGETLGDEQKFQKYGEEYGFKFDFNHYDVNEVTGTYTIEYRVSDGNRTRTYSPAIEIEVVRSFEDLNAPSIDPINTVRHILLGDNGNDTLEIPKAVVSDNIDANPSVDYTMTFTPKGGQAGAPVALDKADILDIEKIGNDYFLKNDKGFELQIGEGELEIECTATDDAGNSTTTPQKAEISVYLISGKEQPAELVAAFASPVAPATTFDGPEVNIGGFTIQGTTPSGGTQEIIDPKFVGFEITLKNPKNDIVAVTLERVVFDQVIYVNNITFDAKMGGYHDLYVRVFDITGRSTVYLYSFNVTAPTASVPPYSIAPNRSTIIPTTGGSINTTYTLRNIPNENATDIYHVLRASGNAFSLIGNDFIANAVGTYTFKDFIIPRTIDDGSGNMIDNLNYDQDSLVDTYAAYSTTVNESEQPVIEILGDMPIHVRKNTSLQISSLYSTDPTTIKEFESLTALETLGWVVLPSVSAYNSNSNAKVEISVKDKDGLTVTAYEAYQNLQGKVAFFKNASDVPAEYFSTNVWIFAPHADGSHTVTYTAKINNGTPTESKHTILIGKIIAPTFTINETPRKSYSIDSKFEFFKIENVKDIDENGNDISVANEIKLYTYTKKLVDPSGNTVVTIIGNQDPYAAMVDNNGDEIILEKSGTYTEIYEVTDRFGNTSVIKREFQVASKSRTATTSMKMLSTILIIVAVLLLAGVVFYIVRFRSVKKIKKYS